MTLPDHSQPGTEAARQPGKDQVLSELIDFFNDELKRDRAGTEDWIAQGKWDVAAFISAVAKLKRELALRD